MFSKRLSGKLAGLVFAGALACGSAMAADIVVRVGPPRPVHEVRVVRPGPDYVWVSGYHRYEGNRYEWVPGRWERPPHAHARWEAHHWVKRNGGWVLIDGRWR